MYERRFSAWQRWHERDALPGLQCPGVYAIAHTPRNLAGTSFSWRKDIFYIGVSNAESGLKGRLRQFENTIKGKEGHGGAQRVRYEYRDYTTLIKDLYVSVAAFPCNVVSNLPRDLRIMGDVVRFEYLCLADYVETFRKLPKFNNKRKSPKLKFNAASASAR